MLGIPQQQFSRGLDVRDDGVIEFDLVDFPLLREEFELVKAQSLPGDSELIL